VTGPKGRELLAQWKAEHSEIPAFAEADPLCRKCLDAWPCPMSLCVAALEEALVIPFDLTYDERRDRVLSKLVRE